MSLSKGCAAALLGALALGACTRETQQPAATAAAKQPAAGVDVVALAAELRNTRQEADELAFGGQTNAAVSLIGKTLADPRFVDYENRLQKVLNEISEKQAAEFARLQAEAAEADPGAPPPPYPDPALYGTAEVSYSDVGFRGHLLDQMVRLSLSHGTPEETLALVLPIFNVDERLGLEGVALVYEDLRNRRPAAELLAWAQQLAKTPKLPDSAVNRAMDWAYSAALDANQDDQAIKILAEILAKRGADATVIQSAKRAVNLFIQRGRLDSLSRMLDTLRRAAPGGEALDHLLLAARARLAAASADWKACETHLANAFAALPDSPNLYELLSQVLPLVERAGQSALMDALAKTLATTQPGKTSSVRHAIQFWERDARANKPADFPNRVQILMDAGVRSSDIFDAISTFFYAVSDNPDPAILQKIRAQGEKLFADDATGNLAIAPYCLIDMAWCLEDFDGVLCILEAGVPEKGESWHTMAAIKIKAHKALVNRQIPEAIEQFRIFMKYLDEHGVEEDFADPVHGVTLPKEALLGYNAKRIADLLADTDPAGSAKALEEARAYYAKAIELAKTPEIKSIVEKESQELLSP